MRLSEVLDEIQYFVGSFTFLAGMMSSMFGASWDLSTNIMLTGFGLTVLAYMRSERDRGRRER